MQKPTTIFATLALVLLTVNAHAAPIQGTNGHFYDRINTAALTWTQARSAAAALSFQGVSGHLVTILDAAELTGAANTVRNGGNCWMGASDDAVEGEWRWVTGELFWLGGPGGSVQGGLFADWNSGEPNNVGVGENFGNWFGAGAGVWNDVSAASTRMCYIVEYDLAPRHVPLSAWALLIMGITLGGLAMRQLRRG